MVIPIIIYRIDFIYSDRSVKVIGHSIIFILAVFFFIIVVCFVVLLF